MRFEPLPPPTQAEVERLLRVVRHRVLRLAGGLLPARQHAPACQRQAGTGAAMPLRGARCAGAGAFVTSGGRPHRLPHEAPAAGRHHAPALHRSTPRSRGRPSAPRGQSSSSSATGEASSSGCPSRPRPKKKAPKHLMAPGALLHLLLQSPGKLSLFGEMRVEAAGIEPAPYSKTPMPGSEPLLEGFAGFEGRDGRRAPAPGALPRAGPSCPRSGCS